MIYRLLGELEIGPEVSPLELPGGSALTVLAALVVNANRRMSAAELIRAGWGSDDVGKAQLYKKINAVRDLLARAGRRDDLKTHSRSGYELRAGADDVDALLFRALAREAVSAEQEHRPEDEADLLRQALRLWRGPHPLSNVPSDAFRQEVVALERRRRRAAARLFDLELARGNHEMILDELAAIAGSYPSDRRLCEQLMVAAHRCGHLADVADAYERHREALAEETGADPDPMLRDFHFAAARSQESARAAAEAAIARRAGAAPRPPAAAPSQLPPPPPLVGRDDLVAEVTWLLRRSPGASAPVVVISGPAGIGKTALAVRAAHMAAGHYPDGQLYVEAHATSGAAPGTGELVAQILRAFGAPRIPDTTAERLAAYRTLLAGRRVLVVLDDAADGTQAGALAPPSPRCAMLVTARRRLPEIGGAHHVAPLEPLGRAEASELFLRVVGDAGISLDGDLDAVGKVVALCGGLPLALRIAGALRVHDHPRPTGELADRLSRQGLAALRYGDLSVARAIGAGFDRLGAGGRELFLGLGLLPLPSFGPWTAAAVLDGAPDSAHRALSELAASFMIESLEQQARYRFHDLTRDYARRRALAERPGDRDARPAKVYQALLTLARRAHRRLYGGDFEVVHSDVLDWVAPADVLADVDASPLDWFEKERASIRAAVEHCAALGLAGVCWDLAVSAHEFYTIRGYFDDWRATHMAALEACRRAGDQRGEGVVLACVNQPALVASQRVGGAAALAGLERAAALLAACGDRHGQAIALRTLGNALRRQGHLTRPLALFHEALDHYAASGDTVGRWQTLRFIGQTHLDLDAPDTAGRVLRQALGVASQLGRPRLIAQTQYWIGQAFLAAGRTQDAQLAFEDVLAAYREDTGLGHAYAAHGLGDTARRRRAHDAAERWLTVAGELAREGADAVLEGRVWLSWAALHQAQGLPEEQTAALERAAAVFAGCGAAYLEIRALAALAGVAGQRGDAAAAAAAWARVEHLHRAAGASAQDRAHLSPGR